jgi:hypothetical protein
MATVKIIQGSYRNQEIKNQTFTLINGYVETPNSKHVTVEGTKLCGRPTARIRVKSQKDFVIAGTVETVDDQISVEEESSEPEVVETDAAVLARISDRFQILTELTQGALTGDIRALFVTGAPGVGKTFGVEKTLQDAGLVEIFSDLPPRYEVISGAMSAVGMYMKLYEFRDDNNVLVIDDCDSVFTDELCLNLLKAALDTSKRRMIHWNVDSVSLRKGDCPNQFEFKGSIIFISNINFKKVRSERMRNHLEALMSRSHFLDLTVHTDREKLLRIEDLVTNHKMLSQFKLSDKMSAKVMKFVRDNASKFNELSLRTVIKLAGLARTFDENDKWMRVAELSMMGNQF